MDIGSGVLGFRDSGFRVWGFRVLGLGLGGVEWGILGLRRDNGRENGSYHLFRGLEG